MKCSLARTWAKAVERSSKIFYNEFNKFEFDREIVVKKIKNIGKIIGCVALSLVIVLPIVCVLFRIHITPWFLKTEYVSRVDRIEGYYVAVYEEDVCGIRCEDGTPTIALGNCSEYTEFDWKHQEVMGIVPYRRFLCFSREVEPEEYILVSEDGKYACGFVFVLRARDKIHYYFRRGYSYSGTDGISPALLNENIILSNGVERIELRDYCLFTSENDYTNGEKNLYLEDTPCCFLSGFEDISNLFGTD